MESCGFPSLILFRPREGYELHRFIINFNADTKIVSVPVRGMSCIPMIVSAVETYNENVSVPVRGMSCIPPLWAEGLFITTDKFPSP